MRTESGNDLRSNQSARHQALIAEAIYFRSDAARTSSDRLEAELQHIGATVAFSRGGLVVEEGNPARYAYRVEDGTLRVVRWLRDGRRCITSFLMAGDYFGLAECSAYTASVETLTDARIVRYPRARLDQ